MKNKKTYMLNSLKFFKDVKYHLLVIMFIYIILGIIGFISPIIEARLITAITDTLVDKVLKIVFIFLVVKLIEELLWHFGMVYWKKKVRTKILFNIRKELVDNIFELKLLNFDKYSTGIFQERIKNDPQSIARVVNAGQREFMQCITKLGVIIYVMSINFLLGLIYIGGVIIVAIVDNFSQNVSKEKNKISRKSDEKVNSLLSEVIRGIRDIKLLNFKNSVKGLIGEELEKNNNYIIEKDTYDSLMHRIKRVILFITVLLVLVVGIKFVDY